MGWASRMLDGLVGDGSVDAELLLRHVMSSSRAELYAHAGRRLSEEEAQRLGALVVRRRAGEPLQYLTGTQSFRQLDLAVGPGVMVPRPETEMVVEHALRRIAGIRAPRVVDLGTGSGAIALSIATERPDAQVWAGEISTQAISWARRNLDRTRASNVTLLEGDLLSPLPHSLKGQLDLVVANPPYLSEADAAEAPADVREHEPRTAIVAGRTGLEVSQRVIAGSFEHLRPGGWLVIEIHPGQAVRVQLLLRVRYAEVGVATDLAGAERIAEGRRPR